MPVVLQKEDVKTLPADVFDRVDSLSAPRLVEYWEQDPCSRRAVRARGEVQCEMGAEPCAGAGRRREDEDLGVTIEAQFVVGEYEIVILSATDSSGLETWLRREKYKIPQGAAEALAPYVRDKTKFFVAKVDIKKVKRDAQGVVQLSPLRFSFDANELRLPVRLGLLNAGGKQDLIVYVIHPTSRFEVANYANTFIPTNLEVADGVRNNFAAFFAELFDATVEKMGRKVVVTEYAWQTTGCDPCPTPPLSADDLATLGLDVLEGIGVAVPPPARQRSRSADAPMRRRTVLRRRAVVGADAPARPLQQGDAVRGSDLPRGEAGDGRARELERHQRRRGRQRGRRRRRRQQLPGPLHHPPLLDRAGRVQDPQLRHLGRAARQSGRAPDADGGEGAGDRAARQGRADGGGALAGAAARASPASRRTDGRRRSDRRHEASRFGVVAIACAVVASAPGRAHAFCGFFVAGSDAKLTNNASQVVLMRKGNRTVMTMPNNYKGPPENFAMVVPVPVVLQKEDVKTLPADVFERVDSLSAPRLVEYWEQDPCSRPRRRPTAGRPSSMGHRRRRRREEPEATDLGVTVEAQFVVGEYEIVILSAKDSTGLDTWLRREKYNIPQGAAEALAPYVRDKSKFFVAKVDIKKVKRDARASCSCRRCASPTTPTSCACRCAWACSTRPASRT